MQLDGIIALVLSIISASVFAFMLFKKMSPYVKQMHRISLLKEHSDLVKAEAEIVEIKKLDTIGLRLDPNSLFTVCIRYSTENAARGFESSELVFTKEPPERTGEKIEILYGRDEPESVMTFDNRELSGTAWMLVKHLISVLVFFGIVFAVFYCLCRYGLPDD